MDETTRNEAQPPARKPGGGPFERLLWHSRLLTLIPVTVSVAVAVVVFLFATLDAWRLVEGAVAAVVADEAALKAARLDLVAHVVKLIDLYLVATFLLIFAMGLYELFVGKIEIAESTLIGERLLLIRDLDDLKERLSKILVLILSVLFLEYAVKMVPTGYLDLLFLASGILVMSTALFLLGKHKKAAGDAHR